MKNDWAVKFLAIFKVKKVIENLQINASGQKAQSLG